MSFFGPVPATQNGANIPTGYIGEIVTATNKQVVPVFGGWETTYAIAEIYLSPGVWLIGGILSWNTGFAPPNGFTGFQAFIEGSGAGIPSTLAISGWYGMNDQNWINGNSTYYNTIPTSVFNITTDTTLYLYARVGCSNPNGLLLNGINSEATAVRLA